MKREDQLRVALVNRALTGPRFKVGDIVRLREPVKQHIPKEYEGALLCIEFEGGKQKVLRRDGEGFWYSEWRTHCITAPHAVRGGYIEFITWYVDERYIDLVCPVERGLTLLEYLAEEHDDQGSGKR